MRRNRPPSSPTTPYRALAHHLAHHGSSTGPGGQQQKEAGSVSSVIRSFNVETNPTRPMRPSPLTASTIPDMPLDLVDRIRSFPLFMSAPEDFLNAIVARLKPQVHLAHETILAEGDEARAMYWLVRGVVAVTSRDGEAVYAELKPGAFFGEIGVLMDVPRTATIIARTKCMLVVLKKEDLQTELPKYPDMEKAIRQEAQERLAILKKKRQEGGQTAKIPDSNGAISAREPVPGEVSTGEVGAIQGGAVVKSKKRKSPSPGAIEDPTISGSALGSGYVNVRKTLKELPLFSTLPPDILHFLGLSAEPKSYPPFTDIIRQGAPGNEIYFIVRGEAEVIHETSDDDSNVKRLTRSSYIRPRLRQGQYFGEVASLGLSEGRTATVRSITSVECLIIGGKALEELWRRCPPEIKHQVEETARERYHKPDEDVEMVDVPVKMTLEDMEEPTTPTEESLPLVTFTTPSKPASPTKDERGMSQPIDPDPYLSVDMENLRNRRRNSLAPPTPISLTDNTPSQIAPTRNGTKPLLAEGSPLRLQLPSVTSAPADDAPIPWKRARTFAERPPSSAEEPEPLLPDDILVVVFQHLDIVELIRLRLVCTRWRRILTESPKLCTHVDLSPFNRKVNDWSIANIVAPFVGNRPVEVDISNCFHVTDEGFQALWRTCGKNVKCWKMRSVWDVSATQILEMSDNAKGLEEVDWSNCRKVGDNLLARVVGWVVPEPAPPRESSRNVVIASSNVRTRAQRHQKTEQPAAQQNGNPQNPSLPPPGTVIGCPSLRRLNLSYCKHITDRSMAHMAAHASNRLEYLSLTRCTSITDAGFQSWSPYRFSSLTHLYLADCTYLSDNSIIALCNAAKNLTHLDLSFCCALSDTATEVVALGLPLLRELRLAFCGSAVSDASLGCIALHLNELRGLSVRGCVRVTGVGVENVLEGCGRLEWLDVSQCKNLGGWVAGGGVSRWGFDDSAAPRPPSSSAADDGAKQRGPGTARGGKIGAGGVGGGTFGAGAFAAAPHGKTVGGAKPVGGNLKALGPGPMMKPIIPPRGVITRRTRKPVRFIVQKGADGLR
ncbi:RNI-like protein [Coniochaeta hoffmannii]|uniref:RNI-like protein n=1 Tax=Coniochaeta hoffmannii TaxID=91930 RepID=A0AA38SCE7_9PEZI|nr:RNI-like protein [Coniochaeta hoffmannii]